MTGPRSLACPDPALLTAVEESVLEAALEADIRRHLAECSQCREIAAVLRESLDHEPTLEARARVAHRIGLAPSPSRRWLRWGTPLAGLAAAAAVLVAVALPDPALPEFPARRPSAPGLQLTGLTVFHADRPIFVAGRGALAMRGQQSDREVLLAAVGAALDDADAGRFEVALAQLARLQREHPASADVPLAIGAVHLLAGRPAEAIAALEHGRTLAAGSLLDEFDWQLAVAFVAAGTSERARPRLVTVCEHGGPRSALACAGLGEIGKTPPSPPK